jgi:hypothetical protein
MKLLREISEDLEFITEGTGADKKFYLRGITVMGDVVNKNGRLYPFESVLKPVVESYIENKVKTNAAYGECGHPATPIINPERISHRFVSVEQDGTNYIGKALVTNNPMGVIIRNLVQEGGRVGFSSRGAATLVSKNNINEVQGDLVLSTIADCVIDPSAPEAFARGVMENVEWVFANEEWTFEAHEKAQKAIRIAPKKNLEVVTLNLFESYLKTL